MADTKKAPRATVTAKPDDADLGPLRLLSGKWENVGDLKGHGWNMIALPFVAPGSEFDYRLLLNQYDEELEFFLVDKNVPNRGVPGSANQDDDQEVVTLDYQQVTTQIAVDDRPQSDKGKVLNSKIHHEPGLWLHMRDHAENGINIARLASVPHGDSVLALGTSRVTKEPPQIPAVNGLPIGVSHKLGDPYLAPYAHFHQQNFKGLFDPVEPHQLLIAANQGVNIERTTELEVDTQTETGGIVNIPFVVKQANATRMRSTFWIQELAPQNGVRELRLQYLQIVFLEFFERPDKKGLIKWPHVSINTLKRTGDATP